MPDDNIDDATRFFETSETFSIDVPNMSDFVSEPEFGLASPWAR